jgi:hypothetical protein
VVLLAFLVALTIPRGRAGELHGEPGKRFVVAEMTNIDAGHEPEA